MSHRVLLAVLVVSLLAVRAGASAGPAARDSLGFPTLSISPASQFA